MIKLEVFDNLFHRLGLINSYSMMRYTDIFNGIGSFELQCPATKENVNLLFGGKDRLLWIEDDVAGIIQYNQRVAVNQENTLSVKGCLIAEMLNWRYIYPQFNMNDYPDTIMRELVRTHLLTVGVRQMPNFALLEKVSSMPAKTVYQQTGSYVGTECAAIADAHGLGFKVGFIPKEAKFLFEVLYPTDRTMENSSGNEPVIFSREFNNIMSATYTNNRGDYRNTALIAGEGEGSARVIETLEDSNMSGFNRKELFIDARDLQSTKDDNTTMTVDEYNTALQQRGAEKLQECVEVESFESVVRNDDKAPFTYGRDYKKGDKVTVIDKELSVSISATITEVTITYDKSGYTVEPTFGYGQPTLNQKLKKKGVL